MLETSRYFGVNALLSYSCADPNPPRANRLGINTSILPAPSKPVNDKVDRFLNREPLPARNVPARDAIARAQRARGEPSLFFRDRASGANALSAFRAKPIHAISLKFFARIGLPHRRQTQRRVVLVIPSDKPAPAPPQFFQHLPRPRPD